MSENREQLRQAYQRTEATAASFIPAKPKVDIYGKAHVFRVCAYCRVSTDNDEQLSSYELQLKHYQQLAGQHPNWDLRHIYADEGISGTSLKKRDDFNEMIAACERGEYDLIITKSVSRFARNLVDCISLVRRLKNRNPPVGVFFETDNLNTLSENSEFMMSFLATFAQEESVKKSESMVWSLTQRFKDGKLLTPELLGYYRPKDAGGHYIKYARLEIIESEAEIVRFIFDAFIAGTSIKDIAALLTDIGCPTKTGMEQWSEGSISYILRNERYCGNVLTWKTFTSDMFEHKHRKNRQDRDQYLYTNHHDAIITVETFEAAQVVLENRRHHSYGAFPTIRVIDDGIFRGYIPINHHWVHEDPNTYFTASNSVDRYTGTVRIKKSQLSAFNLDGYQVVRGQFLSSRPDCPCVSATNNRITFNTVCMRKFAEVQYVQLLLHPTERKIAIRPCRPNDVHSIRWRVDPSKPFIPKTISCPHFGNTLFQIMDWNPDFTYHIRGTWAARGRDEIIVFQLSNAVPAVLIEPDDGEETVRRRRMEICPEEWSDSFGDDFYDYAVNNSFFFLSPRTDWKAHTPAIAAPGIDQPEVMTQEELDASYQILRKKVGTQSGD